MRPGSNAMLDEESGPSTPNDAGGWNKTSRECLSAGW